MSGAEIIDTMRELLGDTDRGRLTPAFGYYKDSSILAAVTSARMFTYCQLVQKFKQQRRVPSTSIDLYSNTARIAIGRMLRTAPAASGATIGVDAPDDFYVLECGQLSTGKYVPAFDVFSGERMRNTMMQTIYARGGRFYGAAATAVYWASPSEVLDSSPTQLTEFSDAFYDAIKYLAVANLLQQEQASSLPRYNFYLKEYARRVMYLR